jgi:hypothetical protein
MDRASLAAAFAAARLEQAQKHGRPLTPFDNAIGDAVLRAATLAMEDVAKGRDDVAFRVVTAPTGSGKSCSAAAVIASAFRSDPQFTCAYVVETIRQADEMGEVIAELIGRDNVTVWTSAHDTKADPEGVAAEHGRLTMPTSCREALRSARVAVCTHRLWKDEATSGTERGARSCNGRRRSVVFVDEHPTLVALIERTPGDLMKLRDRVLRADPEHPWLPILAAIVERADEAFRSKGQTYVPVALVTAEEGKALRGGRQLREFVDAGLSAKAEEAQIADLSQTLRFLQAASRGCVFLSRRDPLLVAYELEFEPGPGHVLLDATADLTGMIALLPGTGRLAMPTVDYSPLSIFHVEQPARFRFIPEVVTKARTARPYAEWIKDTVLQFTSAGEDVLLVTHKDLIDHAYLPDAGDPTRPVDWQGRRVNVLNWGAGIGSNRWKNKGVVFLFSEFFVPRRKAIADVHAWTGEEPTAEALKAASTAEPSGSYLTAYEGHLLRWTKQLACRGTVRNIGATGKAGTMRLYTSMDLARLLRTLPTLFPGVRPPVLLTAGGEGAKGVKGLCRLLATDARTVLWSDEVEHETGIAARDLSRTMRTPKVKTAADLYGWSLASAKAIGQPGKRKALVRTGAVAIAA